MQVVLLKCVRPVERSIHARDSCAARTFGQFTQKVDRTFYTI
jgi:hypothetical protein